MTVFTRVSIYLNQDMIKNFLLSLSRKSSFVNGLKTKYIRLRNFALSKYFSAIPLKEKTVIFEAYHSSSYACSPKAIYEYMLSSSTFAEFNFVWSFTNPEKYNYLKSERTRLVKHETFAYFKAFATSKYWVVNGWINLNIHKKPNQIAMQCWHGSPLKRLRYDISENIATAHRQNILTENDLDIVRYDYFVSPSRFASQVFTSAFNLKALGKEKIMIETGYPRNDYLSNYKKSDVEKMKRKLNIPKNKKIILYAPTWRDDQRREEGGYQYTSPVDFGYLKEALSDKFVMLYRGHGLAPKTFDLGKYQDFIIDVSDIDDVNDVYIISNILITDYSSVFFDYAILNRPILFFMYDKDHYQNDLRGFYIDLSELPGPIVETEESLVEAIGMQRVERINHQKFNYKYNYLEDGSSTRRAAHRLITHD